MKQPIISFIINKKPYRLSAGDTEAIRNMPGEARQQLIVLLDAIKQEENLSQPVVQHNATTMPETVSSGTQQPIKSDRLHSGDADALMAQLIMEEELDQKPGLTKELIYKWMAGFFVVIVLLILLS